MRIAYVVNYQGPDLVERRPCLHNFSLAARVKVQLLAGLLRRASHEVEIISQGALEPLVGANRFGFRFHPEITDGERFDPDIPIFYVSALSVQFLIGAWERLLARRLLARRHRRSAFDTVIIYNLQSAQIGCATYARKLGLPVLLQYEDDAFVDVHGRSYTGMIDRYHQFAKRKVLRSISGGTAVSPYLLSQMPHDTPKCLLRGVVSDEIVTLRADAQVSKKNWVVFSGTHERTQGLEQLIAAWHLLELPDWELHIAGHGPLTPDLERMANGNRGIVFHGLLNRVENAQLLCRAKIGMNPQDLTSRPGNVFAFKIVEYLAAATHVITTPRGELEPSLEAGVSYIRDNTPTAIAASLKQVIENRAYERTSEQAALQAYGPDAVCELLNGLLEQVTRRPVVSRLPADVSAPLTASDGIRIRAPR